MNTFPELIKKIRKSADLTQVQFAKRLDVSPVLITMIETGQKEVSKKFVSKLANALEVHPSTITPFLFIVEEKNFTPTSDIERVFIGWGEKMQEYLIKKKAKKLKLNA